jgi:hypothetical protein
LFLIAARLLLCAAEALAFLFAIDGLIILALYAVRIDRGDDEVVLTSQMPLFITASYYVYCRVRKLI